MDGQSDLRAKIVAINNDPNLTEAEKAVKRQELMCGKWAASAEKKEEAAKPEGNGLLDDESLKCTVCFDLCDRPVTGPCQHNYCLSCFKHLVARGNRSCPTCRASLPAKLCENPRINTLLTHAIRLAKQGVKEPTKAVQRVADADRPAEAFTTDRAVRSGRANAASGRIMVTVPNDHFGPITAEHDPERGRGVQVGDWWADRLDCRQWGAHFPHVAGIAGQSNRGAQSVVLSGGYEDDRDEGEWFMYTGSGGRDLSGNKRTNKTQSFDQEFENMNKALQVSCLRGLPVRVVRSFKEKRSSYAPSQDQPVRYDGIYRILRCWRKAGKQGFLMCRYLFVRCDNAPAPWDSGETGDGLRLEVPKAAAQEMKEAKGQVYEMGAKPYWDYDPVTSSWGWAREAPPSQKSGGGDPVKRLKKKVSAHEKLLRDFSCGLCKGVLTAPLSMPCGHTYCKPCLDTHFEGPDVVAPTSRSLRIRKVPKPCPKCNTDLGDYLCSAAVNIEMEALIKKMQEAAQEAREAAEQLEGEAGDAAGDAEADDEVEEEVEEEEAGDEEEEEKEEAVAGTSRKGAGGVGSSGASSSKRGAAAAAAAAAAEGGGAGSSRPTKRQKPAAAAAAVPGKGAAEAAPAQQQSQLEQQEAGDAAAGGADAGKGPAPAGDAAAASEAAAAPTAAAAPAAGGGDSSSRWLSEAAALAASYPSFDVVLIQGMLEDQGGDALEVAAQLKRMKNQEKHAARQQSTAGSSKAANKRGKAAVGKGKKRGSTAAAATEEQEEEEEEEEEKQEEEQAAAAAGDTSNGMQAEEGSEQQHEEEEGAAKAGSSKAAAASTTAAATAGSDDGGEAVAGGSKKGGAAKRAAPIAAGGSKKGGAAAKRAAPADSAEAAEADEAVEAAAGSSKKGGAAAKRAKRDQGQATRRAPARGAAAGKRGAAAAAGEGAGREGSVDVGGAAGDARDQGL